MNRDFRDFLIKFDQLISLNPKTYPTDNRLDQITFRVVSRKRCNIERNRWQFLIFSDKSHQYFGDQIFAPPPVQKFL